MMDCQGESLEVRRARERKFLAKVEDVKESAKNFQGKIKKKKKNTFSQHTNYRN